MCTLTRLQYTSTYCLHLLTILAWPILFLPTTICLLQRLKCINTDLLVDSLWSYRVNLLPYLYVHADLSLCQYRLRRRLDGKIPSKGECEHGWRCAFVFSQFCVQYSVKTTQNDQYLLPASTITALLVANNWGQLVYGLWIFFLFFLHVAYLLRDNTQLSWRRSLGRSSTYFPCLLIGYPSAGSYWWDKMPDIALLMVRLRTVA